MYTFPVSVLFVAFGDRRSADSHTAFVLDNVFARRKGFALHEEEEEEEIAEESCMQKIVSLCESLG